MNAGITQEKVENLVLNLLPTITQEDLSPEKDIFALGLDSINAMTLVFELQSTFGVTFAPTEIQFENFRTISSMVALIQSKAPDNKL